MTDTLYAYGPERSKSLDDLAIVLLAIAASLLTARTPLIFLTCGFLAPLPPTSPRFYQNKITGVSLVDSDYKCWACSSHTEKIRRECNHKPEDRLPGALIGIARLAMCTFDPANVDSHLRLDTTASPPFTRVQVKTPIRDSAVFDALEGNQIGEKWVM